MVLNTTLRLLSPLACIGALVVLSSCASNSEFASEADTAESEAAVQEIIVTGQRTARSRESQRQAPAPERAVSEPSVSRDMGQQETIRQDRRPEIIIDFPVLSHRVDPTMVFKHYGVNPTIDTLEENKSTFSIDVDTASYSISKAFLDRGQMPDPDAIRVEEFVNSFDYGYLVPSDQPFSLQAEAFPSNYRPGFHVLHLGLNASDLSREAVKPSNLTLLIDVSGSMRQGNRLEMLKQGLYRMIDQLQPSDTVAIVLYSTHARLELEATEVKYSQQIKQVIAGLRPEDSTNVGAGLELAYRMANKAYDPERNNRIILCSDGVANVGTVSPDAMMRSISAAAKRGIYLNAVGIGMGNYNDVVLEELARQGQGHYSYVDSIAEAEKIFSEKLLSGLQVVARDVRIQVEFDPEVVQSYRLIGYENRAMKNQDFSNTKKDAGEVGMGHSVTAIYEIKFHQQQPLRSFGTLRVNHKDLESEELRLLEHTLPPSIIAKSPQGATANTQLSYIAAAFAEKLRGSYWSRTYSYGDLDQWLSTIGNQTADIQGARELGAYVRRAAQLDHREDRYSQVVPVASMGFDRVPVLKD